MENAFFSSTMTPGCHVSGTERTKTISTSGDKAHGLRAVICRSVDLEGWMQKVFKGGPCHYLNKVSSHSEEKGPVLRRWLILVKGFTLQGSVARWSARERGMEKAGAEAMFLTHFSHITHGRSFLLSAIISPVLKEAHLLKQHFSKLGLGLNCPFLGPISDPFSQKSWEGGLGICMLPSFIRCFFRTPGIENRYEGEVM